MKPFIKRTLAKIDMNSLTRVETPSEKQASLKKPGKGKKSKYGNITCKCNQSHIHRSRFEARVCNDLHLEYAEEIKAGTVEIETEKRFDFMVGGIKICSHYMDFLLTFEGGKELAVEAKGAQTAVWRIKKNLFKALFPEIEYEIRYYK